MTEQPPVAGLRIEDLATIDLMRLHRASLYEYADVGSFVR